MKGAFWLLLVIITGGCAGASVSDKDIIELPPELAVDNSRGLSYIPQGHDECGPAALMMVLTEKGVSPTLSRLVSSTMTPAISGSTTLDLSGTVRRLGLMPVRTDTLGEIANLSMSGQLPILLINIGLPLLPQWHYVIVTGYDGNRGVFHLRSGTFKDLSVRIRELADRWEEAHRWGMVILRPNEPIGEVKAEAYLSEALTLERMNEITAANQAYHSASQKWPLSKLAQVGLANTHVALHELHKAEMTLQRTQRLFPGDKRIAHNLTKIGDFRRTLSKPTK